jgi:1-deoxy-D-xylulose-5-phosphate reductoisomerase
MTGNLNGNEHRPKGIALLGSTGSIGTQTLDVIRAHPDHFSVEVLTANRNATLLIKQAIEFLPNVAVIADETLLPMVRESLSAYPVKVYGGMAAVEQVSDMEGVDIVLTALVGFSGLVPTLKAIESGKNIALANKETLVIAGELVTRLAREKGCNIYPVDSEHSAIFQCLAGEFHNRVEKIYLTASGGPFRGKSKEFLNNVTKDEALKHPNWSMGDKITIDSATLMNKGLEIIEAKWLFGLKPGQIEVIVHPQSIIHSAVQFEDGSMKAQMGLPDMKLPILYALAYPQRLKTDFPRFDFMQYPSLTFEPADTQTFRNLALAIESLHKGGNMPCVLNAANEEVVSAFLENRIRFNQMPDIIETCLERAEFISNPVLDDYMGTDKEARRMAKNLINKI